MLILFGHPTSGKSDLIGIFSRFLKNESSAPANRTKFRPQSSLYPSKLPYCFGHDYTIRKKYTTPYSIHPGTDFCRKIGQENSRIFPDMYPERNAFRVTKGQTTSRHFKVSIPIEPGPRFGRSRRTRPGIQHSRPDRIYRRDWL